MITKGTTIEELVSVIPESVNYFMEKGIRLLICGEPIWGTIEEVILSKGFSNDQLDIILEDLNNILFQKEIKVQ
ncbi:MAG: DUF1858 domain-containing protein [Ignavibacteria bacterium]|nr:DUF1858 domain-containing protein [Ignavibacteria bacterium]